MTDTLTVSKFEFDDWWTSTYIDRLTPLLAQEIEALVDHHWRELQATAIRHSLREQAKKEKENYVTVVCDTHVGGHKDCTCGILHFSDCPMYQEEDLDPTEGCTCGARLARASVGSPAELHLDHCSLYQPA